MKEPEWAKVNVHLDGMTWTIEGIDEVGKSNSEEADFRKSDEGEFNSQANAEKDKYIHFQIDRVFKKEQEAMAQLATKRLCSSFIYHERTKLISTDGSFTISFHRHYKKGEPNSGWCHCSYVTEKPRKQYLWAYKEEGKTKYKPIL